MINKLIDGIFLRLDTSGNSSVYTTVYTGREIAHAQAMSPTVTHNLEVSWVGQPVYCQFRKEGDSITCRQFITQLFGQRHYLFSFNNNGETLYLGWRMAKMCPVRCILIKQENGNFLPIGLYGHGWANLLAHQKWEYKDLSAKERGVWPDP